MVYSGDTSLYPWQQILAAIEYVIDYMLGGHIVSVPLAKKDATTVGWDVDSDEMDLPANTKYVHVFCPEATHIVCNTSTGNPAQIGVAYAKEGSHFITCPDATKLHYKSYDTNGSIFVTAFTKP